MTINWKNYTWDVRTSDQTWPPGFGGWSEENISLNSTGGLVMKLTNPSGKMPIGCEIINQTKGLGYGTYTCVVDGRLDTLHKNVVFGGMFPFFYGSPYIEFDVCEVSKWDTDGQAVIGHNSWYGEVKESPILQSETFAIPADKLQTHRLIWTPGKAVFDSFLGEGVKGYRYFTTTHTQNIPSPSQEAVIFNLWAFANGTPTESDLSIPQMCITLKDFTFSTATPEEIIPTPTPVYRNRRRRRRR